MERGTKGDSKESGERLEIQSRVRTGRLGFHPNDNEKPLKGLSKSINIIKYALKL